MTREQKLRRRVQTLRRAVRRWQAAPRSPVRSKRLKALRVKLKDYEGRLALERTTPYERNARAVLASKNAVWYYNSPTGGTAKPALVAAARGKLAMCPKTKRMVWTNPALIACLADLVKLGVLHINCILNGDHPYEDQGPAYWIHYAGNGLDLDLTTPLSLGTIERVAARHGGVKNGETSHHHFTFSR